MPGADDAYAASSRWAARFANGTNISANAAEQAFQAFHAARWDVARDLLSQTVLSNPFIESLVSVTRGRITLARGHPESALRDASVIVNYANTRDSVEFLFTGLALQIRCDAAEGRDDDAISTCERFLDNWRRSAGTLGSIDLCEVAPVLATTERHREIRAAAQLLPQASRWRNALLLTAGKRYSEAADAYKQIGSHPLAADTHLLAARQAADEGRTADAHQHAEAVLAFAEQTGASLYQQRAEVFIKASA
jgi:hypothetical protein